MRLSAVRDAQCAHIAAVLALAPKPGAEFEFQRLHGMGEALYAEAARQSQGISARAASTRRSASTRTCSPYLVRRLLENGANTSFVNRFIDEQRAGRRDRARSASPSVERLESYAHPRLPLPLALYRRAPQLPRDRSRQSGCELDTLREEVSTRRPASRLRCRLRGPHRQRRSARPGSTHPVTQSGGSARDRRQHRAMRPGRDSDAHSMRAPRRSRRGTGRRRGARASASSAPPTCSKRAARSFTSCWCARPARPCRTPSPRSARPSTSAATTRRRRGSNSRRRSGCRARPANRTTCRCTDAACSPASVRGISRSRSSPARSTAALAAGNAVVAKPAEQTPLIAARFVEAAARGRRPAGGRCICVPAPGRRFGEVAFAHAALAGVAFTGSTATALSDQSHARAARSGAIVPLIAETGGMNAMIVDSTALPEQVVDDVVSSAFMSAGQRCSALRLLFLQDDIADQVLEMIAGAMDELVIGDPADLKTDLGPVITPAAADGSGAACRADAAGGAHGQDLQSRRGACQRQFLCTASHRTQQRSAAARARNSDRFCTSCGIERADIRLRFCRRSAPAITD